MVNLAKEKLSHEYGSIKHVMAMQEQGIVAATSGKHEEASSVLLHAASLMSKLDQEESLRTRHLAAHSLARSGQLDEALSALRENVRLSEQLHGADAAETAQRRASLGKVQLLSGKVEHGSETLQDAMHHLHQTLGHAHPVAHQVQRLWAVAEICDWTADPYKGELLRSI